MNFARAGKISSPGFFCVNMKILIFGAGAVGGYFGGKLFVSGSDVTFLVRDSRKKQLLATGLKIYSPHGDFSADIKCKTVAESAEIYDLVLLCCKAYQLENAIKDLKDFLKKPPYSTGTEWLITHSRIAISFGKTKFSGPRTLPQLFLKKVTSNN